MFCNLCKRANVFATLATRCIVTRMNSRYCPMILNFALMTVPLTMFPLNTFPLNVG
jgi:hypothetical protein